MIRVVVIGGETHIGEITALRGKRLEIVGAAVREDQLDRARREFGGFITTDVVHLLDSCEADVAAIANENDRKAEAVLMALSSGLDVIVDKPIAIQMPEQDAIEEFLAVHPERRLLNLLTLRGQPAWRRVHDAVAAGEIGEVAFCHVRMAVQLRPETRPSWFLDCRRSGGLFLDLLIHGLDVVEWCTGQRIVALTAATGNLSNPAQEWLRDHAAVFCELENGASALVEGQRMLPPTKASDYRMTLAGTEGYVDLVAGGEVRLTNPQGAEQVLSDFPPAQSVVADWLDHGDLVPQEASLRANRLALLATQAAEEHVRLLVEEKP